MCPIRERKAKTTAKHDTDYTDASLTDHTDQFKLILIVLVRLIRVIRGIVSCLVLISPVSFIAARPLCHTDYA